MTNALSRRDFIATATAVAIAASGPALGVAAPPAGKSYKKAVKIGMVKSPGSLADKFKLLKKLSFDGIELDSPNAYKVDEVLAAKESSGLEIPGVVDSVHWRERLSDPNPEVRAKGVTALQAALKDAKAYGGTSVLLVPGKVDKEATYQQCWERSILEIKKCIPLAEELGIDILLENVWNDFLTDPKETARFIDELGSKRVGAHFDVGNAVRYSPPASWIPILGDRIKKLDIKDYSLKLGKDNLAAGFGAKLLEGDSDWPAVMKALRAINYVGWGTAEIAGGDEAWLRETAERMDKIFTS